MFYTDGRPGRSLPNVLQLPVERSHAVAEPVKVQILQPSVVLRLDLDRLGLVHLRQVDHVDELLLGARLAGAPQLALHLQQELLVAARVVLALVQQLAVVMPVVGQRAICTAKENEPSARQAPPVDSSAHQLARRPLTRREATATPEIRTRWPCAASCTSPSSTCRQSSCSSALFTSKTARSASKGGPSVRNGTTLTIAVLFRLRLFREIALFFAPFAVRWRRRRVRPRRIFFVDDRLYRVDVQFDVVRFVLLEVVGGAVPFKTNTLQ